MICNMSFERLKDSLFPLRSAIGVSCTSLDSSSLYNLIEPASSSLGKLLTESFVASLIKLLKEYGVICIMIWISNIKNV